MVAKSYQALEQIGEPYKLNNRMYVDVKTAKGATKAVRWYTESEYNKMYGVSAKESVAADPIMSNQKTALGFEKGYITIFKGDTYSCLEWFHQNKECRYSTLWGWYVISTEKVPENIPFDITPVQMCWEPIADKLDPTRLISNSEVIKSYVNSLIYDKSNSKYVGKIGERLAIIATVKQVFELESGFDGSQSYLHIFIDNKDNEYVWVTSARKLETNVKYSFRGTVKDHRMYKNSEQTVLTRCSNFVELERLGGEDD